MNDYKILNLKEPVNLKEKLKNYHLNLFYEVNITFITKTEKK